MKTFKKLFIILLLFLLPYIFSYLCVSFVNVDFNFANWSWKARKALVILSTICSFVSLMFYFSLPTQQDYNFYK
jgi:hypothetical protein